MIECDSGFVALVIRCALKIKSLCRERKRVTTTSTLRPTSLLPESVYSISGLLYIVPTDFSAPAHKSRPSFPLPSLPGPSFPRPSLHGPSLPAPGIGVLLLAAGVVLV